MKTALVKSTEPPAPGVKDVVSSPGLSLEPSVRTFTETRFGHDFSQVRVHTDAQAAESARGMNALAYTSGNHIAFDAGRYAPQTPTGMRLLSHELTHVVQQGRAAAPAARRLNTPGDFHERQAGTVADAFMRGAGVENLIDSGSGLACPLVQRDTPGSGTQPVNQTGPAPPPPPPPLDYDRTGHTRLPLPTGHTAASITKLIDAKVKAGDITGFTLKGVASGSNAEKFVLYLILSLSSKDQWGKEADVITDIDWPAKPGDPPPQARVTMRIDTTGAASAELIGTGPVPAIVQTTVAAGSAKLKTDFGFAAVKDDGTAKWSPAEISDVAAALAMLPTADKPALKGVELIRVQSLGADAGEFSTGGGVAKGATAVTSKPWLKLADLAFPATAIQFYGGTKGTMPASFQTILHEVGHAVEKEVFRAANEGFQKAMIDANAAAGPLNETVAALKPLNDQRTDLFNKYTAEADATAKEALRKKIEALDAKIKPLRTVYDSRRAKYDRAEATRDTKKAEVAKTRVTAATVQPLEADATTKKTAAASSLAAAKTAVQALTAPEVSSSAAYLKAVEDAAAAITTFATDAAADKDTISNLETLVLAKVTDRDTIKDTLAKSDPGHTALTTLAPASASQDTWLEAERVLARARKRTLRVQKFIDLVTTSNIQRFTKYSKDNWLLKPEEFYAEAYSLWLVDPQFVETNYKVVYDFFQNGDYRK